MLLTSTLLFAAALVLSAYAILVTVAQKWNRIEQVMELRGTPIERGIRLGAVRQTGQRLRLVVVNELDAQPEQQTFAFGRLRAA